MLDKNISSTKKQHNQKRLRSQNKQIIDNDEINDDRLIYDLINQDSDI